MPLNMEKETTSQRTQVVEAVKGKETDPSLGLL